MKKSFSLFFRKILFNRNITIPFSIIIAFLLWLGITMSDQTSMERTFSVTGVSVNLESTAVAESGMSVINDVTNQSFTVKVKGKSGTVSKLKSEDINLYVNAAEVDSPGTVELKVFASNDSSDNYNVVEISPSKITVDFDYIDTKEFEIVPVTDGIIVNEAGLVKGTEGIGGLESNIIKITGPRKIVGKISKVTALVDETKVIKSTETFDAKIIIYGEDGHEIKSEKLSLNITDVKVTVPVYKQKTVPVKADFSNLPDGFDIKSLKYKIDHSKVLIEGLPDAVEQVKEITLNPIDLRNISVSSYKFEVQPNLPEGIRIFDAIEKFVVVVDIDNYDQKSISVSKMEYEGLAKGLKVNDINKISEVNICAPKNILNKINSKNTYAKIDLTDKKAGKYTVNVVICFKGYDKAWAVGSYKTTLTIK